MHWLNPPIMNIVSFVLVRCTNFRTEAAFVVTSCQGWLGLNISSDGQEAVWFFCCRVIRHPPTPPSLFHLSLPCKCDAKHLKVLSPVIKGSSLSVTRLSDSSPHRGEDATQWEDAIVFVTQKRICLFRLWEENPLRSWDDGFRCSFPVNPNFN